MMWSTPIIGANTHTSILIANVVTYLEVNGMFGGLSNSCLTHEITIHQSSAANVCLETRLALQRSKIDASDRKGKTPVTTSRACVIKDGSLATDISDGDIV
jgi:hypothetical protein